MSKNLAQVYTANPITTIGATDLLYVAQSGTTDAGISGASFATQFSPLTTKGDLYTFSTANARLAVGGSNGQILQVNSAASTGLAWSTASYPTIATGAGTILRANGTNWLASTSTFADTYAASTILYSNGANTVTGLATADNGLLVTNSTGVPSILAGPGTTGNILQSNAAAAPSFSTATFASTYAVSTILYANASNVVTGLATTNSASLSTNATGVPTWLALTDGQIVIGSSAGAPLAATLSAGTGVSITNGHNTITIASNGANPWVDETGSSVTMASNTGYTSDDGASLVTFTLPTTAAIGDWIEINGKGSGGWTIAQASGQQIHMGSSTTTSGASGSLSSSNQYDCVRLRCLTANTIFTVVSVQGNLTVV